MRVDDVFLPKSAGPCLLATYFEIPVEEFPALAAREAEFDLSAVHPTDAVTAGRCKLTLG